MLNWQGRYISAHILSWELYNGTTVPKGLVVRHTCDRHQCLNPQHLEIGSHGDNVADREARGRGKQPKGIASGRAKLTEDQVRSIRLDPRGKRSVAAEHGVSAQLVKLIRQRRIWTHIT